MATDRPDPLARLHELKCWPPFWGEVDSGAKTFEIRKNDRDYRVGDVLKLREWFMVSETYTGRECLRRVTYVTDWMQSSGYVVLGLAELDQVRASLPAPSGWQPIETAPKDGTPVLILDARQRMFIARYKPDAAFSECRHAEGWEVDDCEDCWYSFALFPDAVRHWMPIPDPPNTETDVSGCPNCGYRSPAKTGP